MDRGPLVVSLTCQFVSIQSLRYHFQAHLRFKSQNHLVSNFEHHRQRIITDRIGVANPSWLACMSSGCI